MCSNPVFKYPNHKRYDTYGPQKNKYNYTMNLMKVDDSGR